MMKVILSSLIIVSSLSTYAATTNCNGYGPDGRNLVVLLDDEADSPKILAIGFEVMGQFFDLRVSGCQSMKISEDNILCNSQIIGVLGAVKETGDSLGYSRTALPFNITTGSYDFAGSCRPNDKQPLTLIVKE